MQKNRIDIITLGCSKNLVDAERLMRRIEALGYTCVHDPEQPRGQIAIISTCGFIGDAKEESINTILRFVERKKHRQVSRIYVMGCLSERYLHELETEIPEVDAWFGKFDFLSLLNLLPPIPQATPYTTQPFERTITTPTHYTYLKISEGCNRFCSYCAIPLITGRHTSRPIDQLLDEVRWLVTQGVREFNVIAQDLSSYGLDLYHEHRLPELIDRMAQIPGVEWIRLHYAYPTDFPYDLLPVMARRTNVCKYLDIAVQHCSDHMLTLMRRHITSAEQNELLTRIRREVPGICLRTTILVGHPGETNEDFEQLKQWVRTQRFDRLGAFAYSDEEGTYANRHYKDDVPDEVKQQRLNDIMAIQQEIAAELSAAKVGTIQRVIIDRQEGDYFIGRTQFDSPEVDCEVLISATHKDNNTVNNPINIGQFYSVRITRADEFDLYGTIC